MSESKSPVVGQIAWTDLTVPEAAPMRDFYRDVVGWSPSGVSMGDYEDYSMRDAEGVDVAGVCHARGSNAGIPAQWMVYIVVKNLEESLASCERLGGKVIRGAKPLAGGRFAIIEDPAGAICALYQTG